MVERVAKAEGGMRSRGGTVEQKEAENGSATGMNVYVTPECSSQCKPLEAGCYCEEGWCGGGADKAQYAAGEKTGRP